MRTQIDNENARASSIDDAQPGRRVAVTSGLRLPYQERIRLKKLAQRRAKNQQRSRDLTLATLNVGSMTGKGREVVDFMERRNINILFLQETKWKGKKARELGEGYKLFYNGENSKENGIGIVLDPKLKEGTGCKAQEKEDFWRLHSDYLHIVRSSELLWLGGDLNGHVGTDIRGMEDHMGKHGYGDMNEQGEQIRSAAEAADLAIIDTYFSKPNSQKSLTPEVDGKKVTWNALNEVMRTVSKDVLRVTSGKPPKADKDAWWWTEEV
ncbi:uncharacterized protein LOC134767565 [Penaeus indicus]|uniref:uncharacterized protein LOC134767565 n=1 Tax=Penaeus indicus TaxID=29960 RepID=UPI00300CECF2